MELTAVARVLVRRWYVVIVGLVVTAGLGYLVYGAVPPTYEAKGSILLLPPSDSVPDGSNPLLLLGGLEQPASLVVAYLDGDIARAEMAKIHPTAGYTIAMDGTTRGPVITVWVDDKTAESTEATLTDTLAAIPTALDMLQQQVDVPAGATIGSTKLVVDDKATVITKATQRAVLAVLAVGVLATAGVAVGLDALLNRSRTATARSRRPRSTRPAREAEVPAPSPTPEPIAPYARTRRASSSSPERPAVIDTPQPASRG